MTMSEDRAALREMLSYQRPADTKSERKFIARYIYPLGVKRDKFGNLYKRVGDKQDILFSCHTDTVHRKPGRQLTEYAGDVLQLGAHSNSNCLGADDGAGIWLASELIRAKVPGLYVFHRAEEIGGRGSQHIANRFPALVDGCKAAIAFDRKGTGNIITHQVYGRCCSDPFAKSLGAALHKANADLFYKPDDTGTFTDTANYQDLIGECSNLSVGYQHEHGPTETLDTAHLFRLRDALCTTDWAGLEYVRQPGDPDPDDHWAAYDRARDKEANDNRTSNHWGGPRVYDMTKVPDSDWWLPGKDGASLRDLCARHPEVAANMLECYSVSADDFIDELNRS